MQIFDQLVLDVADSFGDLGSVRLVVIGFAAEFVERLRRSGMDDGEIRRRLIPSQ